MKPGDIVWYIRESRVHSATVISEITVKNSHDDWCHTPEQKKSWQPFGPSGTYYATCHGIIKQEEAFATKEELLASL